MNILRDKNLCENDRRLSPVSGQSAARARFAPIVASIIIFLLAGCSIFDLRDPEPPLVGAVTEDPLNISVILSIARGSAVNMEYRDYFTGDARFEYPPVLSINGRDEVINMLNRLRARASHVEWEIDKGEKRIVDHNLQIVDNVPYTVYSGGNAICTGIAYFRITRDLDWMISYWKDVPDGGQTPFFEP